MNPLSSIDRSLLIDSAATLGLLVGLFLLRMALQRAITNNPNFSLEQRRRWSVTLRNGLLVAGLISMILIWATELHSLLVSLAAFAVAMVIATKELLLCFSGAVMRSGGRLYDIGDRIEVAGHRGTVIDLNMFSTLLVEDDSQCHQRTGRVVTIPNALLLNSAVVRESFLDRFVTHQFNVPIGPTEDWRAAEHELLRLARAEAAPVLDEIRATAQRMIEQHALSVPVPEPAVTLLLKETDKLMLVVHVPTHLDTRHPVEQRILRGYLDWRSGRPQAEPVAHEETATTGPAKPKASVH
ncbi:mechanosensitive ion channel family protein [Chitinimonas lacunae]|uniref:Small-conductance mechanosensitive channel n=1 Tax=Chitinimonas lacunae TaxID=1963018 RepID=A0ABV8MP75_9NEIS